MVNPGFMVNDGKGFQLLLANGMTVSVQWGSGNYCRNRNLSFTTNPIPPCATAETAVWGSDGNYIKREEGDYDTVQGDQTPDKVAATIAWAAGLPANFSWPIVAEEE